MATLSNICRRNILYSILRSNRSVSKKLISTSEKKKEATEACSPPESIVQKIPDFSKPLENKNWISFGFNQEDKTKDRYLMHFAFFMFITIGFCGSGFVMAYFPDKKNLHWARREAYIQLYERERLGLEAIDPNFINPAKIVLPPDNEIAEEDIIL